MGNRTEALLRLLEASLRDRLARFPAVVLTGPRQSGKTTLVRGFSGAAERRYDGAEAFALTRTTISLPLGAAL